MIQDLTLRGFQWRDSSKITEFSLFGTTAPVFSSTTYTMRPFRHVAVSGSNVSFHGELPLHTEIRTGRHSFTQPSNKYKLFRHCARCGCRTEINIQEGMFAPYENYDESLCEECAQYFENRPSEYSDNTVYFSSVLRRKRIRNRICQRWSDFMGMV